MKQTAVEYLIDQLFPKVLTAEQYYHIEQAKKMEKEQIMEAYNERGYDIESFDDSPEEYYNKTYKNK